MQVLGVGKFESTCTVCSSREYVQCVVVESTCTVCSSREYVQCVVVESMYSV